MPITNDTTLTIGLVITLMGAASSFGVMWNKINNTEKKHQEDQELQREHDRQVEERFERIEDKIDRILEILANEGYKKN